MPRCSRKTVRCKFNGKCVTKASKPYTEKQKKRCPKGTRKCGDRVCHLVKSSVKRTSSRKSSVKRTSSRKSSVKRTLSRKEVMPQSDIDLIIKETVIKSEADKKYVTSKLKKLKFEKGYRSIFTGQLKTTLYSQALDKIYAWHKYGDEIE